jgi:hypothetical protein
MHQFHKTQRLHLPEISPYLPSLSSSEALALPEKLSVVLPSSLDHQTRVTVYSKEIINLEERLRCAQAIESLARLRMHLRARAVAHKHVSLLIHTQAVQTRQKALRDQLESRIKTATDTYRTARKALLEIKESGDWVNVLQELKDEDIRGIGERLLQQEEKDALRKAQELAGIQADEIQGFLGGSDNIATVPVHPVLTRGESRSLQVSWIWYTSGEITQGGAKMGEDRVGESVDEIVSSVFSVLLLVFGLTICSRFAS